MGKYKVMQPAKEVDVSAVKYKEGDIKGSFIIHCWFWLYTLAISSIYMNMQEQDLDCRIIFIFFFLHWDFL